jgi:hypothetical protein
MLTQHQQKHPRTIKLPVVLLIIMSPSKTVVLAVQHTKKMASVLQLATHPYGKMGCIQCLRHSRNIDAVIV